MKLFRSSDFEDATIFSTAVCLLFSKYPASIGRQVIDPYSGLPAELKFPPKIADIKGALESAMIKRRSIAHRAQWMLDERAKREAEAMRRAEIDAVSPERKAQLAAELKAAFAHADVGDRKKSTVSTAMDKTEEQAA